MCVVDLFGNAEEPASAGPALVVSVPFLGVISTITVIGSVVGSVIGVAAAAIDSDSGGNS